MNKKFGQPEKDVSASIVVKTAQTPTEDIPPDFCILRPFLLVPTRIPVRQVTRPKEVAQRLWRMVLQGMVHGAKEVAQRLWRMGLQGMVHGVQKEQMDHVLKRKKKQKPTDREASDEN